jgi:hypothetical protein
MREIMEKSRQPKSNSDRNIRSPLVLREVRSDQASRATDDSEDSTRLMTRPQAAKALNISLSKMKTLEKIGTFKPKKMPNGWNYYPADQIEKMSLRLVGFEFHRDQVKEATTYATPYSDYDAELAAIVFEKLAQRVEPTLIVQELVIHPETMKAIYQAWSGLQEGLFLPEHILQKINRLRLEGSFPAKNAEQFLTNLEETERHLNPSCAKCKKNRRLLCAECAGWRSRETPA